MQRLFDQSRIVLPTGSNARDWLREALAALPEPWMVLATRRHIAADGPPWARYIVLHPAKGVALVDVDPAELAVAPLEDFFDHTGLAAFQSDALPIVAVTLPKDGSAPVADTVEAAFAGSCCQLRNPYWCEAVVELLLTTPELSLTRLRRAVLRAPIAEAPRAALAILPPTEPAPHGASKVPVDVTAPSGALPEAVPPAAESTPAPAAPARHTDEPDAAQAQWLLGSQSLPPRPTWRNWPTSPVAAAAALLAIVAIVLVSRPALLPNEEAASPVSLKIAPLTPATIHAAAPTLAASLPSSMPDRMPPPQVSASAVSAPATAAVRPPPRNRAQRIVVEHQIQRPPAVTHERHLASAGAVPVAACADVLHPERPGGWQYHGPPVRGCLPIRLFGLIGMR